jgi:hypothetical protein
MDGDPYREEPLSRGRLVKKDVDLEHDCGKQDTKAVPRSPRLCFDQARWERQTYAPKLALMTDWAWSLGLWAFAALVSFHDEWLIRASAA